MFISRWFFFYCFWRLSECIKCGKTRPRCKQNQSKDWITMWENIFLSCFCLWKLESWIVWCYKRQLSIWGYNWGRHQIDYFCLWAYLISWVWPTGAVKHDQRPRFKQNCLIRQHYVEKTHFWAAFVADNCRTAIEAIIEGLKLIMFAYVPYYYYILRAR